MANVRRTTLRLLILVVVVVSLVPVSFLALGITVRNALDQRAPEPTGQRSGVDQSSRSYSLGCVADPPASVEDANQWLDHTRSIGRVIGFDVGASVELRDGRSVWVFGDSIRAHGAPGPGMVRNSMLVVDDECIREVTTNDGGPVIEDLPDGTGYWPATVARVARAGGDRLAMVLFRVETFGENSWDFRIVGTSVAEFWVPTGGTPELERLVDIGKLRSDDQPIWGVSVVVDDPHLHIYGTAHPHPDDSGWALYVARTHISNATVPRKWQYWDGSGWSDRRRDAQPVIAADGGVSRMLSVFRRGDDWYVVSKRDDFLGTDLVIWKGDSPQGPFVATPVRSIPSTPDDLQYMALAHPHLLTEPGSIVVSWSRNGGTLEEIREQPARYRPLFARVPLP